MTSYNIPRCVLISVMIATVVTVAARWLLSRGAMLPDISPVSMAGACEQINTVGLRATLFLATSAACVSLMLIRKAIRNGFQIGSQATSFGLRSLFVLILLIAIVLSLARLAII
jgi:hypothetical protein